MADKKFYTHEELQAKNGALTPEEIAKLRRKPKMEVEDFLREMNKGKPPIDENDPKTSQAPIHPTPTMGKQTTQTSFRSFSDPKSEQAVEVALRKTKPYKPKKRIKKSTRDYPK